MTDKGWQGKRVLVTGAGGFIGSHLAERLVECHATVKTFVHYNALGSRGWLDHSDLADQMEIVAGDIRDRDCMHAAVKGCEVVYHLAALIGIPYSYRAPSSYIETNVNGTLNVLQACRDMGVQRLVHTSTSEVYGAWEIIPMDEEHSQTAHSSYAASKIAADKLVEAFHAAYGLPAITLRPFNCFGPRQSTRAIIPTIISQLLTGPTVQLGNVYITRDFNYVRNTVDAFLLAGLAPGQDSPAALGVEGRTINVGSGQETSLIKLVGTLQVMMGYFPTMPEQDAQRVRPPASEVDRLVCDATLARSVLGWEPKVSLEEGLRRTIDWMRQSGAADRAAVYAV